MSPPGVNASRSPKPDDGSSAASAHKQHIENNDSSIGNANDTDADAVESEDGGSRADSSSGTHGQPVEQLSFGKQKDGSSPPRGSGAKRTSQRKPVGTSRPKPLASPKGSVKR